VLRTVWYIRRASEVKDKQAFFGSPTPAAYAKRMCIILLHSRFIAGVSKTVKGGKITPPTKPTLEELGAIRHYLDTHP
jgi:hypothetical protein